MKGNVELGVKPMRDLLNRFNEVSREVRRAMRDADMDKLLAEQAQAAGRDRRRATAGSSTARSRSRWTRCAARRATRT